MKEIKGVDPMEDEVVLREGGFNLRRSDLEFLKGPCFVTDRLIDSYFSVFLSAFMSDEVLFIPSSITYWLANADNLDEIARCLDDLDLTRGEMVLFPINNDRDFDRINVSPRTHWSLLVYDSFEYEFIHFDDAREDGDDTNDEFAMRIYDNIENLVPVTLEEGQEESEENKTFEFRRVKMADPAKGFNKYDCGLHVIAMAVIICEWYLIGRHSKRDRGYEALIQEMDVSEEWDTRQMIKEAIMKHTGKDIMKLLIVK